MTTIFRYSALYSTRLLSLPTCSTLAGSRGYSSVRDESTTGGSRPLSTSERRAMIERIIRVDHAGELGADRIYAGQLAVLSKTPIASVIKHMWEQEKEHLSTMERLVAKHRVEPTILSPLWTVAGFALGAGSALLGKESAMACTVAVEELIGNHYNR
uniref:Uncharacterized protein n=1 Tax=Plectus sambesii TaxID=2011161 RepID=A0A914VWN7_9BILA